MTEPDPTSLDILVAAAARAVPTPDADVFAGVVAGRLRSERYAIVMPRPLPERRWQPKVAVPVALVAASVVIASMVPSARSAVGDLLGGDGRRITPAASPPRTTTPPTSGSPAVTVPATTLPADPVAALNLGTPTTLQQAARLVGFRMRLPTVAAYQHPDAVLVASPPAGGMASMIYLATASRSAVPGQAVAAVLSEFRGHLDAGIFQVLAGNSPDVQAVQVGGSRGYWLPSGAHLFPYVRPDGVVGNETIRLGNNTLVWSVGGITYRFETAGHEDTAIAIAVSMR